MLMLGLLSTTLPIAPCVVFLSLTGIKRLSEKGVVKRPLDDLAKKLKFKFCGKLRLTLPLEVTSETLPAGSLIVQRILPLDEFAFTEPETDFISIRPLVDFALISQNIYGNRE